MSSGNSERILDDLQRVVDDAETLLRETAGAAGQRAEEARAEVGESLRRARERLQSLEREVLDQARSGARETDRYVREHPWQSIGVAAAIGLLLGALLTRR